LKGQFKKRAGNIPGLQAERALTCPFPVGGMACSINMDNQMTIKLFTNRIHLFRTRLIGRNPLLAVLWMREGRKSIPFLYFPQRCGTIKIAAICRHNT
jgi:hypothetical protein